jgi:hypothetical protein
VWVGHAGDIWRADCRTLYPGLYGDQSPEVEGDAATGKRREGLDCEDGGGGRHYAARARACRPSFLQAIGKVLTLLLGTLLFEQIGRCRVLTLGRTWEAAGKAICWTWAAWADEAPKEAGWKGTRGSRMCLAEMEIWAGWVQGHGRR